MAGSEASETALLAAVGAAGEGGLDSSSLGWEQGKLVGLVKSLEADRLLESQAVEHSRWVATAEGKAYAAAGTPEARVWEAAGPGEGVSLAQLKARAARAAAA